MARGLAVVVATWATALVVLAEAAAERPVCTMAEALVGAVDAHLVDWDKQLETAMNTSHNCSIFLEFIYVSRDRILTELDYVRGNFTHLDEQARGRGEEGLSTTIAMSHMSTAASLLSAHLHIHGAMAAGRRECLSEHLQLLFLMSLRRIKTLLHEQLRHLWVVFQGTSELLRQGAGKWLTEIVELFEADLQTMESILASWRPPIEGEPPTRPGPPLPAFSSREPDGLSLSTVEVLRLETFDDWTDWKQLIRFLLRHVLPRDGHIGDLCAGGGQSASFLNDTGIVTAYAFDPSPNIRLLSKGVVEYAKLGGGELQLWRDFDMTICLTAAADLSEDEEAWGRAWKNVEAYTRRGAVIALGGGLVRQQAIMAAAAFAPALRLDEELTAKIPDNTAGVGIFWRQA